MKNSVTSGYIERFIETAVLILMATGTVMQATMLLEQVDWLPAGQALWDSSRFISEQSTAGQLLYAVFGYEATPSATQAVLYMVCLLAMAAAYYLSGRQGGHPDEV